MKIIPDIELTLDNLFNAIKDNYTGHLIFKQSVITFELTDNTKIIYYTITADKKSFEITKEKSNSYDLLIKCSAMDWLKIAGKKINPIIAVITGKLKLIGNSKLIGNVFTIDNSIKRPYNDLIRPPQDYEYKYKRRWRKPEKVVAILASPRGKDGYTYIALNKLIEGINECGVNVETIDLSVLDIRPCTSCFKCWFETDGICVINDDFKKIKSLVFEGDLFIYAFPVFVDGVPGILKNFFDRGIQFAYPYFTKGLTHIRHPRRSKNNKFGVVLSGTGLPELNNFDGIISHFETMKDNRRLPILDYILFPQIIASFINPLNFPYLEGKLNALKSAGKQIIEKGKIDKKVLKVISKTIKRNEVDNWINETNLSVYNQIIKKESDI